VRGRRWQSSSASLRGAAAAIALAVSAPSAQGCGRWGYGALAEFEPGGHAGSSTFIPEQTSEAALDAGSTLLATPVDASIAREIPEPFALGPGDASIIADAGTLRLASCDELPPLATPPTLDGQLEPGLGLQPVQPAHWTGPGSVPAGQTLFFAAAWLPHGLYFYLQVEDPDRNPADGSTEPWQGDGVEVYVDHDAVSSDAGSFDDPGTRQLIFTAPPDDVQPGERAEAYLPPAGRVAAVAAADWIMRPTTTGYALELSVSAQDLGLSSWTLMEGAQVGFDLAHNISAPPGEAGVQGNRIGQYFLRVGPETSPAFYPFQNSGVFCTPTLLP
jgi:hypothetical protein